MPTLYGDAARFVDYCREALGVRPTNDDFGEDFSDAVHARIIQQKMT